MSERIDVIKEDGGVVTLMLKNICSMEDVGGGGVIRMVNGDTFNIVGGVQKILSKLRKEEADRYMRKVNQEDTMLKLMLEIANK